MLHPVKVLSLTMIFFVMGCENPARPTYQATPTTQKIETPPPPPETKPEVVIPPKPKFIPNPKVTLDNFEKIEYGASRQQIEELLGKPSEVKKSTALYEGDRYSIEIEYDGDKSGNFSITDKDYVFIGGLLWKGGDFYGVPNVQSKGSMKLILGEPMKITKTGEFSDFHEYTIQGKKVKIAYFLSRVKLSHVD